MTMHNLTISEPVVVGRSRPHETRWGYFQFPSLCRLPGGALMATVSDAEDATCGYGQPLRRYVSAAGGGTWQAAPQAAPGAGPQASCAAGFDGEYLILSASATFDLAAAGLQLPPPSGKGFAYCDFHFYRVSASLDGGRTWGDPAPVIAGDAGAIHAHTCGYTNLLPVSDDTALLVYSDFKHIGPDGLPCKSVKVRRITAR